MGKRAFSLFCLFYRMLLPVFCFSNAYVSVPGEVLAWYFILLSTVLWGWLAPSYSTGGSLLVGCFIGLVLGFLFVCFSLKTTTGLTSGRQKRV